MASPYSGLEDYRFWRRAVSSVEPHLIDPVVRPKFKIDKFDRVATAGSCFAQHISRKLSQYGFMYFTPEDGASLSDAEARRRNFKVFSARYGNIYTVAQLRQLIDEVFEAGSIRDECWQRSDGRYVDPKRPQIEPDGFVTPEAMLDDRRKHLAAVGRVFEQADVLVFTLGLTEAWRSKADRQVYPLAPGVAGGEFDPTRYEFVNYTVEEVTADLEHAVSRLKVINPRLRMVLTVSPVPLIATYEDRHVLVSTVYSKSVLRVAAETVSRKRDWIDYFPSYEIITGSPTGGLYYEDDKREANALGVAHAMRCFLGNYTNAAATRKSAQSDYIAIGKQSFPEIVCDEEAIDQVSAR